MKTISTWTDIELSERKLIREKEIEEIKRRFFAEKLIMPKDNISEFLDVAWQEDRMCTGNPIGYILVNNPNDIKKREFIFAYSELGLKLARLKGFRNLVSFPNTENIYISKQTIFPTFLTKLPQKAREDLRGNASSETDLLVKYSGVYTDDVILVPPNYFGRIRIDEKSMRLLQNIGSIDTVNEYHVNPVMYKNRNNTNRTDEVEYKSKNSISRLDENEYR